MSLRELIARTFCDFCTERTAACQLSINIGYFGELADSILALIRAEIEQVENPYKQYAEGTVGADKAEIFEQARKEILERVK